MKFFSVLPLILLLLCLTFSVSSFSSSISDIELKGSEGLSLNDDKYKGKRHRNKGSEASKMSLSRQSKAVRKSIKRNQRYNKRYLAKRTKKQKRQKRFSATKTFR